MWLTNFLSEIRNLIKSRWWVGQLFSSAKRFQTTFVESETLMITCFRCSSKWRRCFLSGKGLKPFHAFKELPNSSPWFDQVAKFRQEVCQSHYRNDPFLKCNIYLVPSHCHLWFTWYVKGLYSSVYYEQAYIFLIHSDKSPALVFSSFQKLLLGFVFMQNLVHECVHSPDVLQMGW